MKEIKRHGHKKNQAALLLILICFLFSAFPHAAYSSSMADYCYLPPFVTDPNTPPNIMISFDRTAWGKNAAYYGAYSGAKEYYGFFDPKGKYAHNGTDFVKVTTEACQANLTAANNYNCISGNVLNYALMSTLDITRKALIGFGWTPANSSDGGAGDAFSYTGSLKSYGASNARTKTVCGVLIPDLVSEGTFSYFFSITQDGSGSTKSSGLTVKVLPGDTCPDKNTGSVMVNKKDLSLSYTDERRTGLMQKYADSDKDYKYDYPDDSATLTSLNEDSKNVSARFGMRRWKSGQGNDKATDIIDDQMMGAANAATKASYQTGYFKSILDTTSSSPSQDPGASPLGDMTRDIIRYFNTQSTVYSDNNSYTQSPYDWSKDPAEACRKNFALFVTAGQDLSDGSPYSPTSCSSGAYSTPFSQNTCYGYNEAPRKVKTFVVHNVSGIDCVNAKCTHNSASCSTDEDCTNEFKVQEAARVGGGEYIKVDDPATIESKIEEAILNILSTSASASTVATLTTQSRESSTLTQAYFYPRSEGKPHKWVGYLRLLWSDVSANLRADNLNKGWLDLKHDKILSFYYDAASVSYRARMFDARTTDTIAAPDRYLEMQSCSPAGNPSVSTADVPTIWNAADKLVLADPNQTVNFAGGGRKIKMGIDANSNGVVRGSESNEFVDFGTGLKNTLQPFWNYASSCINNTNLWCANNSDCNHCSVNITKTCSSGSNSECYYCSGNPSMGCITPGSSGPGSSCYEGVGPCDLTINRCEDDATRTCTTDAECTNADYGICTSDTCNVAAADSCRAECDSDNCAVSVIKYIRGYDNPSPEGDKFRNRSVCSTDTDCNGGSCLGVVAGKPLSGICTTGADRTKTFKMGDIVYSTPRIVPNGAVNGYGIQYQDASYTEFVNSNTIKHSTPIVVVGANDGMVHAFKVGKILDTNDPVEEEAGGVTAGYAVARFSDYPPTEDAEPPADIGRELWAYVPWNVAPYLRWYCGDSYCHIPLIDARFTVVDASIGAPLAGYSPTDDRNVSSWRRLLVGAMGVGGKKVEIAATTFSSSVFVLDITDTQNPVLLWEQRLPDDSLTTSVPAVIRMGEAGKNGAWYLAFGSGPKGINTDAVTYKTSPPNIYVYNLKTGALETTKPVETGISGVAVGDMLAVDFDQDYQPDNVYFGTYGGTGAGQTGKLYRMRMRGSDGAYLTPANWVVQTAINVGRPIYAAPEIAVDSLNKFWLYFGTGLYLTIEHSAVTTSTEYIYGYKEDPACFKGADSDCGTVTDPAAAFLDTTNIGFENAKATEVGCFCAGVLRSQGSCTADGDCSAISCGDNKVCANNPSQICSENSQCPGSGSCVENKIVLNVKDATLSGSGVPTACNGLKDKSAVACIEDVIATKKGWRRGFSGKKIFSKPFIAGGLVDVTAFETVSTPCSLGGNTHLITLHYTSGTPYAQPTLYMYGGTEGNTQNLTIRESANLGKGVPPLGESLVALPLAGDQYKVITQVSGGLASATLSPTVKAKTGYILWLSK